MLQPNTMVFSDVALYKYSDLRWAGSEDGRVPYENWNVIDRAGYLRWRPVEADTPLRKLHWFWHPNDEASLKSVDELVKDYDESVGHGAQLMLGIAPDRDGRVPDSDVARLKEFGAAIRARSAVLCSTIMIGRASSVMRGRAKTRRRCGRLRMRIRA